MEAGMEARSGEAWYEDSVSALQAEHAGEWGTDEELAKLVLRELPLYFAAYGDPEREYLRTLDGEVVCGDALKLFNHEIFTTFDLRPELTRIAVPTLVITGEEDFICGPVCSREIAAAVDGAELVLLPGCGHFTFVEQPEAFADAVSRFLAGSGPLADS
jgi:proline iminopeptidase